MTKTIRGARAIGGALLALVLGLAGGACGPSERAETPATPAPKAAAPGAKPAAGGPPADAQAKEIFETRCFTCHGTEGAGDGPGSKGLIPPPRNFREAEWQESVSDEHIEKIIMYGGAAVGKSLAMPPNPDLSNRPDVVSALVRHVRSLRAN